MTFPALPGILNTSNLRVNIYHIPGKTKHMVHQAPAVKIVTKICSFVTFVTIVQGTIVTFSVVRY